MPFEVDDRMCLIMRADRNAGRPPNALKSRYG
jgi:hypothetical protein